MRGEARQPNLERPTHDRYESGLLDRPLERVCAPTPFTAQGTIGPWPFGQPLHVGFVSEFELLGDRGIFGGGLKYRLSRGSTDTGISVPARLAAEQSQRL